MENIYIYILLYIALELFEIQWQKADTLMGVLGNLYRYYRQNLLLFFILHPTFYVGIAIAMISDLAFSAIALVFIKTMDIATKIILIQQVFEKKQLTTELSAMLMAPLHPMMMYISIPIYTPLVYFAVTSLSVGNF